jgi:excisionase family DNA binding protein
MQKTTEVMESQVDKSNDQYAQFLYERYLKKKEIANILGTSTRSVEEMMRKRKIPFTRLGGQPRFLLRDVQRALKRYEIKEVSL